MAFFAPAESLPTPATLQSDDTNLTWFPFLDVTSYAHHVFKAFDVNSTGSISFRVPPPFFWSSLVLVIIKLTHNCTISVSGYACLFIHSSPWEFVRKINLVSIYDIMRGAFHKSYFGQPDHSQNYKEFSFFSHSSFFVVKIFEHPNFPCHHHPTHSSTSEPLIEKFSLLWKIERKNCISDYNLK